VAQERDWDALTAPGGALEAVVKAKEAGRVRSIGVTSHNLAMAVRLTKTGLFETVQFPFNFVEDEAGHELHRVARELGVGVLAMKPFAGGVIGDAALVFKFLRGHPGVVPIPGFDSPETVDEVVSFYARPNEVTDEDRQRMAEVRSRLGRRFCRRCEYCQPCPNGVAITMAMGYGVIASRMSPAVAVEFAAAAMSTVPGCTGCEECVPRCPYELPIPEMLKQGYDLYERHRGELGRA
jgi:predicted aldo/keto reductase-like oxidoreductase